MRPLILPCALAALLLLSHPGEAREKKEQQSGRSAEVSGKERRLEDVRRQLKEEKRGLKAIARKESSVLEELDRATRELSEKREELKKASGLVAVIGRGLAETNGNVLRLEAAKRDISGKLKARLKSMYLMRRSGALDLLASAGSIDELGRRHRSLTIIAERDASLIKEHDRNLKALEAERRRLSTLYKEMDAARALTAARKAEAEEAKKKKSAILADIKNEKERRLKVVSELEEAARELSALIGRLRAKEERGQEADDAPGTGFGSMKGRLPMPVAGQVVSFFGRVMHPRFKTVTFNNGIMIDAPAGAPVRSVYEGRVVYAGSLKGYGQVLIVEHRGGYYTLYAHLLKIFKSVGEGVEKGTELGLVGESALESSSGLYFEIRQKGVPKDPLSWLAGK